jgi:hypothetical protein
MVPSGWAWSVSGRQAVELELANGRVFRIALRQPDDFVRELRRRARTPL